jgi:glycerophosphoryl diester phosphodiesterase
LVLSRGRFGRLSAVRTYPFLEHDGPIPFAHRGGAGWIGRGPVENSLVAFQRAVDLGYRYLETDVHATSDGVLLVFHDKLLDRVTDSAGRVAALRADEVAKARIGGQEEIPLLEDLLGTFPEARFNIDVKHATAIDPLVTAVRRTNAIERVCVGSFSDHRLAAVRAALGPDLATSFGPRGVLAVRAASELGMLRRLVRAGVPCLQVPPSFAGLPVITPRFVRLAHRLGLHVHAWTIDDSAEMNRLLDLGVDGIMTDDLVALKEVLVARQLWPGA